LALGSCVDEEVRGLIKKSCSASKSLLRILNNLLELSRDEALGTPTSHGAFSLKALAEDVLALVSVEADKKDITMCYEIEEDQL
jgi:signal transduction histidine kinase